MEVVLMSLKFPRDKLMYAIKKFNSWQKHVHLIYKETYTFEYFWVLLHLKMRTSEKT